jgi:hypothetical protein
MELVASLIAGASLGMKQVETSHQKSISADEYPDLLDTLRWGPPYHSL